MPLLEGRAGLAVVTPLAYATSVTAFIEASVRLFATIHACTSSALIRGPVVFAFVAVVAVVGVVSWLPVSTVLWVLPWRSHVA